MQTAVSVCSRCGWLLPHAACPPKRGALPSRRPMETRARRIVEPDPEPEPALPPPVARDGLKPDPAFDDERRAIRAAGELRPVGWVLWQVLALFRRREGQLLSKSRIETLWDDRPEPPSESLVDVHISKLRAKLRGSGWRIVNIHGHGYILERDG